MIAQQENQQEQVKRKGRGSRHKQTMRANVDAMRRWMVELGLPKPRKPKQEPAGYYEN